MGVEHLVVRLHVGEYLESLKRGGEGDWSTREGSKMKGGGGLVRARGNGDERACGGRSAYLGRGR